MSINLIVICEVKELCQFHIKRVYHCWIIEKAGEFHKNTYFCFIDYAKGFGFVDHNKLENYERDGNTRPPDLPLEKSVCRSGSNI